MKELEGVTVYSLYMLKRNLFYSHKYDKIENNSFLDRYRKKFELIHKELKNFLL
jgi:hypothetical protein